LSVVVKMGSHREMFASHDTLKLFCEKIILPNMSIRGMEFALLRESINAQITRKRCSRTTRTSTFAETWSPQPVSGSMGSWSPSDNADSDTRRQAATEFTRALMENFEKEVTDIVKGYIASFLQVS
jgi:exportin-2 (importin alpha re-exporter)